MLSNPRCGPVGHGQRRVLWSRITTEMAVAITTDMAAYIIVSKETSTNNINIKNNKR